MKFFIIVYTLRNIFTKSERKDNCWPVKHCLMPLCIDNLKKIQYFMC